MGGKEGLKPLRVWQGSWARHLKPKIWGLEIWDLAKTDRKLVSGLARRAPPLRGGGGERERAFRWAMFFG